MLKMKQKPNYGFPLSYILKRFLIILILILILIGVIISQISIFFVLFIAFFVLPSYVIFCIIYFKKRFLRDRITLLKKFVEMANLKGDEIVLDLGTGSGFLAIGFAKNLKNGKSIGLDKFSLKNGNLKTQITSMIKINFFGNTLKDAKVNAKIENVEKKCRFIQADITKPLDFPDKYFNIIVSSQFFYCISPQKRLKVFQEIDRFLKKGGKIIFFESVSFMGWDIDEAKKYFKDIGYKIDILPVNEFKKCCILYGEK